MFVHHLATTEGYRKAQEENNNFVSREGLESHALYRVWAHFGQWIINKMWKENRSAVASDITSWLHLILAGKQILAHVLEVEERKEQEHKM